MITPKKIFFIIIIFFIGIINLNANIEDGLYITVGNKAITKSDIVNEIKLLLIVNNESYSEEKREKLNQIAIKTSIKRSIKEIEIERYKYNIYSKADLKKELTNIANKINIDIDTLKTICESNELDFTIIENQIKTELLWNGLIFQIYKDKLSINLDEINEQLQSLKKNKGISEYLISEIIVNPVNKDNLKSEIENLKTKIKNEGFESVAKELSISNTSIKGGDLGWVSENEISKKFKSKIINTPVGNISEAILLPEGILIFKVKDKRTVEKNLSLEEQKSLLVAAEKTKILNMYSLSHYDKVKRTVAVRFIDE